MILKNARVFLPEGRFTACDVRFADTITALGDFHDEPGFDAAGQYLVPGFFDVHTHGALGYDFCAGRACDFSKLARYYAAHGVTSFLATTMTLPEDALIAAAQAVGDYAAGPGMAQCEGMHLEGPFFSKAKCGAQNARYLRAPDAALFTRIDAASKNRVRMVSVAPELEGAIPFIEFAGRRCVVAIGHTAANYDEAKAAFAAGATQLTHLYNGMPPLLHRAPGPIGAGMDEGAFAELICDGLHVHPAAVRAAFRLFPGRVVLVSDSLPCAGMGDGDAVLAGRAVTVQNDRCTLKNTDTLAGSVITVHDALKRAVSFGVPLEMAVAAATHNPARALRMEARCGAIRPGMPASFVLLDAALDIQEVFVRGQNVHPGQATA